METPALHSLRRRSSSALLAGGLAATLAASVAFASAPRTTSGEAPARVHTVQLQQRMARLPLLFEQNQGQTSAQARFLARTPGANVFLTGHGAVVATRSSALGWTFVGAHPAAIKGVDASATRVTYFFGRQAHRVGVYDRVGYTHLYPGVDLVYYGRQDRLEYDLHLAAGADAARIRFNVNGATPTLAPNGDLRLGAGLTLRRPVAYQTVAGRREPVAVRYQIAADHRVSFALGAYDRRQPLVIDPVLVFSTYLGGSTFDNANAVAADSSGNAYVVGYTQSADFPTVAGSYDTAYHAGNSDAFVAKLSTDGTSLVYATYLGGTLDDEATGVAVDSTGDAYVTGFTDSTDFPTTAGAFQTALTGGTSYSAFVTELNPSGTGLVYSTYLGGSQDDQANSIAVNSSGVAFVGGWTTSTDFPVTAGAPQSTLQGAKDGFITALNAGGATVAYSTHIGGTATGGAVTVVKGLAIDQTNNVYVGGFTSATAGFPVTAGALQSSNAGGFDGFAAKLSSSGRTFSYVTYLGGTGNDAVNAIAVDAAGQAFVTGYTNSTGIFPTTTFQSHLAGRQNAFVAEFNTTGSGLVYASYLGGSETDTGTGIAVDSKDVVYLVGQTSSTQDFPTKAATQPISGGNFDAFLSKVSSAGTSLSFSTYLGGASNDGATGVALDSSGDVYVVGYTDSSNFPVTTGVLQTTAKASNTAFVTKYIAAAQGAFSPSILGFPSQAVGVASAQGSVRFTNDGELPLSITNIAVTGPYTLQAAASDACTSSTTLQPLAYCNIGVVFTPTATSQQNGTLTVSDNGPGGSQTAQLEGTGGDFTVSVSPTTQTVAAGSSASYSVVLTPANGYTQVVSLSCTGNPLPPNSTCVASPTSLTMNGSNASNAVYTVTTTIRPAAVPPPLLPKGPGDWLVLLGLALAGIGAAWAAFRKSGRRRLGWIGTAILLGWAAAAVGCGGSTTNPGTAAGNYTLTFTGTAGKATHSQTATLTVN